LAEDENSKSREVQTVSSSQRAAIDKSDPQFEEWQQRGTSGSLWLELAILAIWH